MIYNTEYGIGKEPRDAFLTFSSPNPFSIKTYNSRKNWDGILEYSTDLVNWEEWNGSNISAIQRNDGYVLYFSGTGNTVIAGNGSKYRWVLTGSNILCIGNIENLLDYATVASGNHPTMATNCYSYMFDSCSSLTHAPSLPATTLAEMCYRSMFHGCSSLTQAPSLPATTLAVRCYYGMFHGCSSLTQAPSLPATTLAEMCYNSMFHMCSSLTHIPALPATTLVKGCYQNMFNNCKSIKLSTTQIGEYTQEYRIPTAGTGTTVTDSLNQMFTLTGGTFVGDPSINTTYYLDSSNTIV